jgi:hypothetical protein
MKEKNIKKRNNLPSAWWPTARSGRPAFLRACGRVGRTAPQRPSPAEPNSGLSPSFLSLTGGGHLSVIFFLVTEPDTTKPPFLAVLARDSYPNSVFWGYK